MFSQPDTELRPPLLSTKLSVPRLPGEFVHRPRLTGRINQGVKGPLTLLTAPAGFGKTNLLVEWAKETTLPVAWLTVDSDDNDLSCFVRYVIGALLHPLSSNLQEEREDHFYVIDVPGVSDSLLSFHQNDISSAFLKYSGDTHSIS